MLYLCAKHSKCESGRPYVPVHTVPLRRYVNEGESEGCEWRGDERKGRPTDCGAGHACHCDAGVVCFDCLARMLWDNSNPYMREQKRYRSRCPLWYDCAVAAGSPWCSPDVPC